MTNPIHKIRNFYTDTVTELKKCTWPTWNELWESTVVVIASSILLGLFVFVVDIMMRYLVQYLT